MRSNFITQSRDKNQIRANFGYKRIGENSNPFTRHEIKNTHVTKTWILSRVYSQTPWLIIKERDTYPPVTSYHGVRRSGAPHILIQGTRQVIYSDLSSVLVIESRHGTNWEWTQAHSSVRSSIPSPGGQRSQVLWPFTRIGVWKICDWDLRFV